jgi:hypothetical protein
MHVYTENGEFVKEVEIAKSWSKTRATAAAGEVFTVAMSKVEDENGNDGASTANIRVYR